jgi:hypothetical protein
MASRRGPTKKAAATIQYAIAEGLKMNWRRELPITVATAAIIGAMITCTAAIERHLDVLASKYSSVEPDLLARLEALEKYACSMDRSLQSIDMRMLPPEVRLHKDRVPPCPGALGSGDN